MVLELIRARLWVRAKGIGSLSSGIMGKPLRPAKMSRSPKVTARLLMSAPLAETSPDEELLRYTLTALPW